MTADWNIWKGKTSVSNNDNKHKTPKNPTKYKNGTGLGIRKLIFIIQRYNTKLKHMEGIFLDRNIVK